MEYRRLAVALLDLRTDPPPKLIVTFVSGLFFFGIAVNLIYAVLVGSADLDATSLNTALGGLIVLLFIAAGNYRSYIDSLSMRYTVVDDNQIQPMQWVITAVSPYNPPEQGRPDNFKLMDLVKHHADSVERIFLVGTFQDEPLDPERGVDGAYKKLERSLQDASFLERFPKLRTVKLERVKVNSSESAEECFDTVVKLLSDAVQERPSLENVVVDVTDGTKPMSVGLSLAALHIGCRLSYLASERDNNGTPITNGKKIYIELKTKVSVARLSSTSSS